MELLRLESLSDLDENVSGDECYVVSEHLLFDLSENIEDSAILSEEDCGTDVTDELSVEDIENEHPETFAGYLDSIEDVNLEDEGEEEEVHEEVREEKEEVEEETVFTLENIALTVSILILVVIVVSVIVKAKKKK